MGILADSIIAGLREDRFKTLLKEYCLEWRSNPTRYAIGNVVAHTADTCDGDHLFDVLTDSEFRRLRREQFGTNALRVDLQRGLDFFSKERPNLLRYIQLLMLEQRAEDTQSPKIHERYCTEYSDFLQLNVAPTMRQDIGAHRVLNRTFPIVLSENEKSSIGAFLREEKDVERLASVELVDYEIGVWRCQCGRSRGQKSRFDYMCGCGAIQGNGHLDGNTASCSVCGQSPTYALCPSCGTRVTLDVLWRIREGSIHPSELRLPLTTNLLIKQPGHSEKEICLTLLQFPLMLGIRERGEHIVFEMPDVFWLDAAPRDIWLPEDVGEQIFALGDSVQYDRQTELRRVLEAMLRRTFFDRMQGRSLKARLKRIFLDGKSEDTLAGLTKGFTRRIVSDHSKVAKRLLRPIDLVRNVDLSFECAVASSPTLSHNMVFVNQRLIRPGALFSTIIANRVAVLKDIPSGQEILTPAPLGKPRSPALDEDGIVRVGTTVRPGQTLVGIESRFVDNWSPEGKLLGAIFGGYPPKEEDLSLTLRGGISGRVLAVHVSTSPKCERNLHGGTGKTVVRGGDLLPEELARITVTIAMEQPIEVGDILHSDDGTKAVVSGIVGGALLSRMSDCPSEPDLVVPTNHPWAPSETSDSHLRYVRVGAEIDTLLGQKLLSRSTGPYSLISGVPLTDGLAPHAATVLGWKDFDWLLVCGAMAVAYEFFGPRSDCRTWRVKMYENAIKGVVHLGTMVDEIENLPQDLSQSPSGRMQHLAFLLRGLGIKATVMDGTRPSLSLHLMSETERLAESHGEVLRPETINYRTVRPERDGLFCEIIFGPTKDYQCRCGKYSGVRHQGVVCEKCGVEVMRSSVRRERMGHISFPVPIVNSLFTETLCDYLAPKFDLDSNDLNSVVHYEKYLGIEYRGGSETRVFICENKPVSDSGKRWAKLSYYNGGQAIRELLEYLQSKKGRIQGSINHACMETIPVIPPDLRPMVSLGGGRFATSDLNDLYRRVINRCNRLKRLIELGAPEDIIRNEKRLLQQGVDGLFDNLQASEPATGRSKRPLKALVQSITDLVGSQSNLLDGLLRRPVDYSAQTRLVAGDTGDLDVAFLPELLAWDLLRPLVIRGLKESTQTFRQASTEASERTDRARTVLEDIVNSAIILIAPSSSVWRLVALRPQLTAHLALTVNPGLMNVLGWENLGKDVRLFAVLSEESKQEAMSKLLPSELRRHGPSPGDFARIQNEKTKSIFYIERKDLISEFARRTLAGESDELGLYDYLVMCIGGHSALRRLTGQLLTEGKG